MSLFGGDDDDEPEQSGVDESIADADAEEFFDDDFDEGGDDGFEDFEDETEEDSLDDDFEDFDDFDEDGGDDFGDFEDEAGDDGFQEGDGLDGLEDESGGFDDLDDGDGGDGGDGGGKSFEELKAEYESGEADWDDDADGSEADEEESGFDEDDADGDADGPSMDEPDITEELEDGTDDPEPEDDTLGGLEGADPEEEQDTGADDGDTIVEQTADPESGAGDETGAEGGAEPPVSGDKPYLETLPSGYVADIVVMDWLEFLVEEAGIDGAARTIAYYEAIGWVDEPAAETLQTFLNGFGGEVADDPEPRSSLGVPHHNTSLRFISRIVNPDMEMVSFGGAPGPERSRTAPGVDGVVADNGISRARNRAQGRPGREPGSERGIEPDGGRECPDGRNASKRDGETGMERKEGQSGGFNWSNGRAE